MDFFVDGVYVGENVYDVFVLFNCKIYWVGGIVFFGKGGDL